MVVVVMPVTQPFGWLRQEGGQFKASLGNLGKLYLKKKFFFFTLEILVLCLFKAMEPIRGRLQGNKLKKLV
jgi:hypothetical protein